MSDRSPESRIEKIRRAGNLLFDMDGVITDTMPRHCRAWVRAFRDLFGIRVDEEEIYRREGEKDEKTIREILASRSLDPGNDRIDAFRKYKAGLFARSSELPLFPGIRECLRFLSKKRKRLALVTGTERSQVENGLSGDLASLFDVRVTGSDVENGKPGPEPYLMALEQLGAEPADSLVLENAPLGIESARSAGIEVWALPTSLRADALGKADHILENHDAWYRLVRRALEPGTS